MSSLTPSPGFTPGTVPMAGAYASPLESALADVLRQRTDPEFEEKRQKRELENALAFYKEQGDQMMRYRMTNDIIGNIGQAARSAFSRYGNPQNVIAAAQAIPGTIIAGTQAIPFQNYLNAGRYFQS